MEEGERERERDDYVDIPPPFLQFSAPAVLLRFDMVSFVESDGTRFKFIISLEFGQLECGSAATTVHWPTFVT